MKDGQKQEIELDGVTVEEITSLTAYELRLPANGNDFPYSQQDD